LAFTIIIIIFHYFPWYLLSTIPIHRTWFVVFFLVVKRYYEVEIKEIYKMLFYIAVFQTPAECAKREDIIALIANFQV